MLEIIGNTPAVRRDGVLLKLEYLNPTGSHKDRTAFFMLREASKRIERGGLVIEYTSGNTGISVAWASKLMGYRARILVPTGTSEQKVNMIRLFGAQVVFVNEDEDGHEIAEEMAREENGIFLAQTKNMANFRAHYETTGPEIIMASKDENCFVMGSGTGGTVYGAGKFLKERAGMKVYALLPKGSYVQELMTGKREEDRQILEGFSYHNYTELLQRAIDERVVDKIIYVSSDEAIEGMRMLWDLGIPGGPTSGAHFYHSKIPAEEGCKPVTIVADSIIRYPEIMKEVLNKKL